MLIFSLHEMKHIWYLPKQSKFYFYFILNKNTESKTLLVPWSFLGEGILLDIRPEIYFYGGVQAL